jgi:hypothetical protein
MFRTGRFALLASAASLAYKNREKIMAMVNRKRSGQAAGR